MEILLMPSVINASQEEGKNLFEDNLKFRQILTNILRYDMLFKHGMGWC